MGSCWAFTSVGVIESRVEMERFKAVNDNWVNFSEQQLINCIKFSTVLGFGKAQSMTSLKFYFMNGPMNETCAPYTEEKGLCFSLRKCAKQDFRITKYYTVDTNNINDVKSSISVDGPAYFRFDVWDDFRDFWDNAEAGEVYINEDKLGTKGGHAVLIIGWDDEKQAWLCRNSWGLSGPEGDGTFWISYQDHLNNLNSGMANVQSNGEGLDYEDILNFPFFCSSINVIKQQSLLSIALQLL
jgi:C1A family cysteine protease